MTEFWIIAGLMTVIALGFVAWPAIRSRETSARSTLVTLVIAAMLVPSAVLLYRHVSTWDGSTATATVAADSEQLALVERLAARLQSDPSDVDGWILLGRSYLTLQRFPEARQAFLQAWQRTPNPGNDLKLGLGIASIHTDRASIGSDGGQLIEEVLASEPGNQQALWYGGMVAVERGRGDLARERWTRLLALGPPPEIARIIEQQIGMLGPSAAGPLAQGGGAPQPAAGQVAPGGTSAGPVIRIGVTLGDGISTANLGPNAALFIFARAQAGGPPLAVIRQPASAIPGEFTLSNANTMIQGNSIDNYDALTLVARLSASGQPTESSGDIFATTIYDVRAGGDVELVLDQIVP